MEGVGPALMVARARPPAAVLLDLGTELMDGFECVQRFRVVSGCEHVPVVAISGHLSGTMPARLMRLLPMPARNAEAVSCGRALLTPTTRRASQPHEDSSRGGFPDRISCHF